ncbi:hypothetical protein COT72_04175 [archaeon CG10_big_fil_rev_8_21_14_0_10_43_11]|nr:MAG: hypothetical protein COT72_04175 [archaeon CG10_big_fil_rev_8_21_14_0_10_43_11]
MRSQILENKYFFLILGILIGIIISATVALGVFTVTDQQTKTGTGAIAPVSPGSSVTASADIACKTFGGAGCSSISECNLHNGTALGIDRNLCGSNQVCCSN